MSIFINRIKRAGERAKEYSDRGTLDEYREGFFRGMALAHAIDANSADADDLQEKIAAMISELPKAKVPA